MTDFLDRDVECGRMAGGSGHSGQQANSYPTADEPWPRDHATEFTGMDVHIFQ